MEQTQSNYELAQTFTPDDLRPLALQVANHYGVPGDLFLGIAAQESGWGPTAKGKAGEFGIMQIMPQTGKALGMNITGDANDDRWHPGRSFDAAARYLVDLKNQNGGDWQAAVRAYNTGKGSPSPKGDGYLRAIMRMAGKEADEHEHFKQGRFPAPEPQGPDVLPGTMETTTAEWGVPELPEAGQVYQKLREYLGYNREPSPGVAKAVENYAQEMENIPPEISLAGPRERAGMAAAALRADITHHRETQERDLFAVAGNFMDGYLGNLPTLGAQAVTGKGLPQPEEPFMRFMGEGAYLAGQVMGPLAWISKLTGGFMTPTWEGLGLTSKILEGGFKGQVALLGKESAELGINLGVLSGVSRMVPAMAQDKDFSDWAHDVIHSTEAGALTGMAFPLLGAWSNRAVRTAVGFAAFDYMRAAPGKYSTLPDFVNDARTWDDESKKHFTDLSYQYLMDLYFINTVKPLEETVVAHQLDHLMKMAPKEVMEALFKATGQEKELEKMAPMGEPPTEGATATPGEGSSSPAAAAPEAVAGDTVIRDRDGKTGTDEWRKPPPPGGGIQEAPPSPNPEEVGITPAPETSVQPGAAKGEKLYGGGPSTEQILKPIQAVIDDTAKLFENAPEQYRQTAGLIRDSAKKLWDWYRTPFERAERGFKKILGKYLGDRQVAGKQNQDFLGQIAKAVPDKLTRRAITRWLQAGGDEATLRQQADASKPPYRAIYERALKLTPAEKGVADLIRAQYDKYLAEAQAAGIVQGGLENYVNGLWKKDKPNQVALRKLRAEINAGLLNTNFNYGKHKVFNGYFEGEQAGWEPLNDDIGYLLGHYHQSMYEAIAARRAIKGLSDGTADDGMPLVGVGGQVFEVLNPEEMKAWEDVHPEYDMTEAKGPEAYLIKPRVHADQSADGRSYRLIDHPSLRKWKFVGKDPNGAPMLMQGDMYVHPDVYSHLNNVLGRSWFREHLAGRAGLSLSRGFKSLLLSGIPTPFHQVNLTAHAFGHMMNPFESPPIDFSDPVQLKAVQNGLMVYSHNALEDFSEGLQPTGIAFKVPGIGQVSQAYSQYLFQDLVPRYKMKLFKAAYERNTERYQGKYTDDQIAELSANQANAAFGELNYKAMGRNPSVQDALRLMSLAPDFLEARLRFVGQAVRPGGREQAYALLRLGLGMYVAAGVANMLFSDDGDPHLDKPFTLVIGKTEYSLRSIPGDMIHLYNDWRGFIYHRLNPTTTKPLLEILTHRDIYGRKRTNFEQFGDYFRSVVPIPLQSFVSENERTLLQGVIQSFGITSYRHRTDAERALMDYNTEQSRLNMSPEDRQKGKEHRDIMQLARDGKAPEFDAALKQARAGGKITGTQYHQMWDEGKVILRDPNLGPLKVSFHHVTDMGAALKVYGAADYDEKRALYPEMNRKWSNAREETRRKYRGEFNALR